MQKSTLYSLCDYAQIFVHRINKFEDLPKIKNEEIEAIIVAYLNYYAEYYHLPLSLYRCDLHEKGSIMNGKIISILNSDIDQLDSFTTKFISDNYLDLINRKYSIHTQLKDNVLLSSSDVQSIINIFLENYRKTHK